MVRNKAKPLFLHFGQCLLLCAGLYTSIFWWSAVITESGSIWDTSWDTKLSYVCQYHSKSLHGLSVSPSIISRLSPDRFTMLSKLNNY